MTGAAAAACRAARRNRRVRARAGRGGLPGRPRELAGRLDPAFLTDAGWDPAWPGVVAARRASAAGPDGMPGRWLHLHRARRPTGGVCWRCFTRLGASGADRAADRRRVGATAVAGLARRGAPFPGASGCRRPRGPCCAPRIPDQFRRGPGTLSLEQFVADPRVRPLSALGPCQVAACTRRTESEPRLLPDPLPAVAHRDRRRPGHRPAALAGDRSPRFPRAGRSACGGFRRWWSSRCYSVSSNACRVGGR